LDHLLDLLQLVAYTLLSIAGSILVIATMVVMVAHRLLPKALIH
jgi:hypothetical protein